MATSIRFSLEIEQRLDRLSKETGRNKSYYIKQMVEGNIEAVEDCYLAEATLERIRSGKEKVHSSASVREQLGWQINYSDTALKELKKLDKGIAKEIVDYLDSKVAVLEDPTTAGKPLTGTLATYWRYRVRDMRVICYLDKGEVTVFVLRVSHRSVVYDDEKAIAAKGAADVTAFQEAKENK